jgi:predicted ATPase
MITKLHLQGFKSFRDAEISLGPLTVLVGANASGKSNLKDALRFLHGVGLGYHFSEILGGKSGPSAVLEWRGIRGGVGEVAFGGAGRFSLTCRASAPPDWAVEGHIWYGLTVDISDLRFGPRVVQEELGDSEGYFWGSNPGDDPVDQRGIHEIRIRHRRGGKYRAHGPVTHYTSLMPAISQLAFDAEVPAPSRRASRMMVDVLRGIRFLDLDPDSMREPAQLGQTVIGDRGENLSAVLNALSADDNRKEALLSWVRALTPLDAVDFEFETAFSDRIMVYLVEAGGGRISAQSASDGTLRFLAVAAALLMPDSGRFFFFDELDNGIHPTRLHLLLQLAKQTCRQNGVQVVGSTHNPAMLTFLDEEELTHARLIVRNEETHESEVHKILDLPDIKRILARKDLGRLHASGWLENAVNLNRPEPELEHEKDTESGE